MSESWERRIESIRSVGATIHIYVYVVDTYTIRKEKHIKPFGAFLEAHKKIHFNLEALFGSEASFVDSGKSV